MAMDAQRQEELAQRIRELRGRTPQRVIAERVGVTERAYQEWEGGGGIAWENLAALAKVLGVSEEYLVYGEAGDAARMGTHLERLLEGQRRLEAKLDTLLKRMGLSDHDVSAITEPHHGSADLVDVSEAPADERAARAVERPAPRTPAPRRAARKGRAGDRSDTSDR